MLGIAIAELAAGQMEVDCAFTSSLADIIIYVILLSGYQAEEGLPLSTSVHLFHARTWSGHMRSRHQIESDYVSIFAEPH